MATKPNSTLNAPRPTGRRSFLTNLTVGRSVIHKLTGLFLLSTLTATLLLPAAAQLSQFQAPGRKRGAQLGPNTSGRQDSKPTPLHSPGAGENRNRSSLLAGLPIDFIRNRGQWDRSTRYGAQNGPIEATFEANVVRIRPSSAPSVSLAMAFEGATPQTQVIGEERRKACYNYYLGNDHAQWRSNVPAYRSILYRSLYHGVDVRIREEAGRLAYDLLLAPGADLAQVVIRTDGASGMEVTKDGALILHTEAGPLRQSLPRTWEQLPNGKTRPLACRFRRIDARRYGFVAPGHDPAHRLVVDPGLEWGTFVGGSLGASVRTVATVRDGTGDVIIAGLTESPDFPLANGSIPFPAERLFVARLNSAGTALSWTTFFGGSGALGGGREFIWGRMAVDSTGGVVVAGDNEIPDFPITPGAFQTTKDVGIHAFVTRFNSTGGLIFSTFLGGNGFDSAQAAVFDPAGNIIVAGTTESTDFPVTPGAFQTTFEGEYDGFIVRLNATGTTLTYGTYLGGDEIIGEALGTGDMVVDANGFVTVTGIAGTLLPVTANALQKTNGGFDDAFLARLRLDGNGTADLKYATYLGGGSDDVGTGLAIDPNNPALVTVVGFTWSIGFPTTSGVIKPALTNATADGQVQNGFVTKFQFPTSGSPSVVFSTYLGGTFEDQATAVAIDSSGNELVLCAAFSGDFPTTRGAYDRVYDSLAFGAGEPDAALAAINPTGSQLLYGSYLGGSLSEGEVFDLPPKLTYLGGSDVVVVGDTTSADFPVTPGSMNTTFPTLVGETNSTGFAARFRLVNNPTVLTVPAPTLLQPAKNSTLPGVGDPVLFTWSDSDSAGIAGYEIEVSPDSNFPPNFIDFHAGVRQAQVVLSGIGNITWFWRVRAADNDGNLSAWSKASTFSLSSSSNTPAATFVTSDDFDITGAGSTTGHVFLSSKAPSGGAVVSLSTDTPSLVSIPSSVTVPAGATSADFPVSVGAIWDPLTVSIIATYKLAPSWGINLHQDQAHATPSNISFFPLAVTGGNPSTGTVFLTQPAASGGATVFLSSANPQRVQVPSSVTVPAGATSASFPITTSKTAFQWPITIAATRGTALDLGQILVNPPGGVTLKSITISPSSVAAGTYATATITMSGPVTGDFDAPIALESSNPAVVGVFGASVTVGSSSTTFQLFGQDVARKTTVTITAAYDAVKQNATLTVSPNGDPLVSSISFSPNPVKGGVTDVGTVTLTKVAPTGGTIVYINASNTSIAAFPASISVPAGSKSTSFNVPTFAVSTTTSSVVTANTGSVSVQATLTVTP